MNSIINGIDMAWDDSGSGPTVCLIHGFPLNRFMWRLQVEALTCKGYRVITPDLRGFGESEAPEAPYTMELYADDLALLFDHLGIENAVICGMSMGGYVLLNLLERYPEKVSAACFIVSRSGADDETGKERRLNLARDVIKSGSPVIADVFVRLLFAERTGQVLPELVADIYRWMVQNKPYGLAGGLIAMAGRKDYTPLLHKFSQPSIIIGAEQDKAITVEQLSTLSRGLPLGKLALIPEAGHMVNLEQPEAFNKCLLDFLNSLSLD